MRRTLRHAALSIVLATAASFQDASAADCPRYLVLQPAYKGQAVGVPTRAYSYGWFGAMPSSESTFHRTYSGTGKWWTYTPGY